MSKVLVDRELLERLMRADADMGREGSASFTLDASDRLDRAWAELRAILAQPEDPEGFEIARHSKRLVEQLRSDLSAVTAERDNYKSRYDDAMDASNIAGFAGMSAAQVIDYQDKEIMQLRAEVERLRNEHAARGADPKVLAEAAEAPIKKARGLVSQLEDMG